ncbi:type III restriction endonuclease [Knoellia sinensis KCTC 19936]|uniref:site-specific DNA-methyltransferase (adenine-specific) n=1 Tax=Knoellia sinensis KCTC 19936 TaxID=1385520 RepID=A0A0A0J3V2_9MICO|nr:Eco57I restriction-modification methylase domain-containing protein [Knoellia sinensis]KGN30316.1 type III restriction endonuclease [Knoellia sinensis KCTC 19936]
MSEQLTFSLSNRNPDVLTCIANLSNDEVFTPPDFANRMLDHVAAAWAEANGGASIWADRTVRFLDPFTKSGVFLREITQRLVDGLEEQIPDLEKRVDHILTQQVFAIGITELTSLLARRSLYCSKWANGEHSVAQSFDTAEGNVWFERREHTWEGGSEWVLTADDDGNSVKKFTNGKCRYCGASRLAMDRGDSLESHAYAFIHTDNIKALISELFGADMQFDVIIGNPPYQMTGGGGGTNDSPIYQLFVNQAKDLQPRLLSMVIPSRFMAGGRGLGDFRQEFLADRRVRTLVDFENAKDAFPTVGIGGGICYFLWNRDHEGLCECTYHRGGEAIGPVQRELDEFEIFVRDPRAVGIVHKVLAAAEESFEGLVSGDTPFGLATNFKDYQPGLDPGDGAVRLYANVGTKRVNGAVARSAIKKNLHLIDAWKLYLPVAGSGREREKTGIDVVLGPPIIGEPASACTQTYLTCGPFASREEAESVESYLRTRLARFLISLRKPAQHVFRAMYRWLPVQTWDRVWTDSELYERYGITDEERTFIESFIKPMEAGKPSND